MTKWNVIRGFAPQNDNGVRGFPSPGVPMDRREVLRRAGIALGVFGSIPSIHSPAAVPGFENAYGEVIPNNAVILKAISFTQRRNS